MEHHNHDHHEMAADMAPTLDAVAGGDVHQHGMAGMDMHMAMSYHFGSIETILFSFWSTQTAGGNFGFRFRIRCKFA